MLECDSARPHPNVSAASGHAQYADCSTHNPRQNRLLAALPRENYERLLPDLELVNLPLGWTIHGADDREKYLYFLTAGIVSRFYVTHEGETAESAMTGNEGVIGLALFLGGNSTPSQARVVIPGCAYRLRSDLMKIDLAHDAPLIKLLLHYTQALITQTGQLAVCNRHHPLDQQLCRWLLSCLDRLPSNEIAATHELISDMIGVRREGVSSAASRLQQEELIHYSRGHIVVVDRPRLEAHACECYSVVKREYVRLFREVQPIQDA